jgi:hypothetical protein
VNIALANACLEEAIETPVLLKVGPKASFSKSPEALPDGKKLQLNRAQLPFYLLLLTEELFYKQSRMVRSKHNNQI